MAENNNLTIFQRLSRAISRPSVSSKIQSYNHQDYNPDQVLFATNNKEEYERKLEQFRQQKLLSYQWVKAGWDNANESLANYTPVKLMYRDADLMCECPEIGQALNIISDEACSFNSDGEMIHIYSSSNRVKSILEDLFVNRLNLHVMLPMVCRDTLKYGNCFMLLNIDSNEGIMGWKKLPVYEIDRIENQVGVYGHGMTPIQANNVKPDETKFVWLGHNESVPYLNWQMAHFRLLYDSFFLPFGTSHLHKARRAWRMWSMMEDAMLIYRLDKSVERRVFKINVGAINDTDVPAYIQSVANNFKRAPIVDPQTGQVDLRKNFIDVSTDFFIPVRGANDGNTIEPLPAAQNPTSMDDINYMQNKIFAGMGVPKEFLNYQQAQGKGQNLSLIDIRFCRMVNRVQQFLLMELNKIALIHLYLLGLSDELSNFTISLNNPSAQIESLELDDWTKRLNLAAAALTDPGTGYPLMSYHMVLKKFLKLSDSEIKDMINEIRLEKAMAAELENTSAIIKKTGLFDKVDRIYGDYDALNGNQTPQNNSDEEGGPGGGGGGGMPPMGGGDLGGLGDLGDLDMGEGGDVNGESMDMDMSEAPEADNGQPNESVKRNKPLLTENGKKQQVKSFTEKYFEKLSENDSTEIPDTDVINEEIGKKVNVVMWKIDQIIGDEPKTDE